MADESKTEEATSARIEQARAKGDVPNSKDFTSFLIFVGFGLVLYFYGHVMLIRLTRLMPIFFEPGRFRMDGSADAMNLGYYIMKELVLIVGPLLVVAVVFAIAGSLSQFGMLFTTERIGFNFEKLNFIQGLSRLFSKESLIEMFKSIIKVSIFGVICYFLFKDELSRLNAIGAQPVVKSFAYFIDVIGRLFFLVTIFLSVLGIVDFAYQKWAYAEKLKMSMQEVKDEHKMSEGDPKIKGRIRQLQREASQRKQLQAVPTADVVVTNPTHVAVALKYTRGQMRAPMVVAKGAGFRALKIKELAAEAQVPIMEKRDLARYLYRNVEVGDLIPENLYTAVAEVMAFVYRIKNKMRKFLKPQAQIG